MPRKKKAIALKYNLEQDPAPVVIASGYGEVAERIINIAEERGIPVYRDDSAASMLCMLEVGASIPEDLYQVVATIYIQIMETANRVKEGALSAGIGSSASRTVEKAAPEQERERAPGGARERALGGATLTDETSRAKAADEASRAKAADRARRGRTADDANGGKPADETNSVKASYEISRGESADGTNGGKAADRPRRGKAVDEYAEFLTTISREEGESGV